MAKAKQKIVYKAKDVDCWVDVINELINSPMKVSLMDINGERELWIDVIGESYRSIVLSRNGTWRFE